MLSERKDYYPDIERMAVTDCINHALPVYNGDCDELCIGSKIAFDEFC